MYVTSDSAGGIACCVTHFIVQNNIEIGEKNLR